MFSKVLVGGLVGRGWSVDRGWSVGRLGLFLGVDGLTLVLNVGDVAILVDGVGHDLDAGVRKGNPVGSGSLVAIPGLQVAEVVGVGVANGVLEVVGGGNVGVDLNNGSGAVGGSGGWSVDWCGVTGPSGSDGSKGREDKDLAKEFRHRLGKVYRRLDKPSLVWLYDCKCGLLDIG